MEETSPKIFHIGHISPARHNWNYPRKYCRSKWLRLKGTKKDTYTFKEEVP
jgi:hypothetical protein